MHSLCLNSSLRILWGEHFFTKVILKSFKSKFCSWIEWECMESADSSHLVEEKQLLWVLVRSWDFCTVLPK